MKCQSVFAEASLAQHDIICGTHDTNIQRGKHLPCLSLHPFLHPASPHHLQHSNTREATFCPLAIGHWPLATNHSDELAEERKAKPKLLGARETLWFGK